MSNPEEKIDMLNSDLSKDNNANKESGFDTEEQLDLEIGADEKNDDSESKSGVNVKTIIIVALLLLPIIFIVYKTMGKKSEEAAVAQSNPQQDIAACENAASTNPTYGNLLNLSNAYINNGLAGKAIAPLEKAIALNPDNAAVAYSNLGLAYTIIQRYKSGIQNCQKALDIDSGFLLAKNNLNWAKAEQQKVLDAIVELDKQTEDKKNIDHYILLGLNYLKLEEHEKSIEVWEKGLQKDPNSLAAIINIGVSYMSLFEYDKAIAIFTKATVIAPNDQLSKNNLNWALSEKKAKEELKEQEAEAKKSTGVVAAEKENKKSKK